MYDIGVVVLNYRNYLETHECVKSLLSQSGVAPLIIIVDNGSANGSVDFLREQYGDVENVVIIESSDNLGFARGNNLGIHFAREIAGCTDVVVLNNDTVLAAADIIVGLRGVARAADVGVISPRVLRVNGSAEKPHTMSARRLGLSTVRVGLLTALAAAPGQLLAESGILRSSARRLRARVGGARVHSAAIGSADACEIHGCAFMLTEAYFKHYTGLCERTFLYGEEINLSWFLKWAGLRAIVVENVGPVIHAGAASTGATVLAQNAVQSKARLALVSMARSLPVFFGNVSR